MGLLLVFISGITSALFGLGYKFRSQYGLSINRLILFFALFMALFAFVFALIFKQTLFTRETFIAGIPMGACTAFAIYYYHRVMEEAKLNVTWTVIQFCVLIPFFVSIGFYNEVPTIQATIGIVFILVSIPLFGIKRNNTSTPAIPSLKVGVWLFVATLLSGGGQSLMKLYASTFHGENTFSLIVVVGLTMSGITAILLFSRGEKLFAAKKRKGVILTALYMSMFFVMSSVLLITGLISVDGSIAYPLRNALNIIVVFALSYFLFKETARRLEYVGAAIALAGIIILSSAMH
jgi:drug/metabolite transporter (DMT)-like permease